MLNKSVCIDVDQYKAAIKYIAENNPYADQDEEYVRSRLDTLIKDAFSNKAGEVASLGLRVCCYDYNEDETHATCEIYVDPAVGGDHFYIEMAI